MYQTSDIYLASYLDLLGFKCTLKKMKANVVFEYENENEVKIKANNFYNGDGQYLTYANILRNMKARIINT